MPKSPGGLLHDARLIDSQKRIGRPFDTYCAGNRGDASGSHRPGLSEPVGNLGGIGVGRRRKPQIGQRVFVGTKDQRVGCQRRE